MIRWLAIVCLLAAPAGAQVFKPKTGTGGSTATTTTTSKSKAKKASTKTSAKKSSARKSKKKSAAAKGRPSDLTPDEAPKVDPDYVKIIDDDDE